MADQILSPLVGKLVDCIAVPVGRQFSYLFRYNGNLEEFRSQLRGLEMAGLDVKLLVEAAERNGEAILPSVEDWLKRVEAVSDESKRFVGEEDAISKCCFNGPLNLKVRYQRSRKAMKKAAEFDRIKKDGIFDSVSLPAPPLQIGSMNNENEFDFESRRSVFNEIMDAIKDDGVDMIGIWGMPGIGKTTLVKRVGKYAKDEGLFEVVAMAVVSQNPSVKDIQGQIADAIGLKFTSESKEGRAGQLFQRLLAMKKILVILDDIWEYLELNDIGIPSGSQHKGCKIILTSRKRSVCEEMRTGKNFKIDLLSANEALSLFLQMSGIDHRCSEKGRLAENLCEECGRLPVCIVIVARGSLNKEQSHWTDTLNRLRNSDPDSKVRAAIELSYDRVEREEEKTFFLLCALFPEDYDIPVRVLFEYGIGLDLFKKVNNVDEAVVRAHKLASSLKSSSLLLDARSEEYVKMHDVVRDAALAIASEGKNACLVTSVAQGREWREKMAVSLWSDDVKKLPDALQCPQLQILMLKCRYLNRQLPDNFFVGMRNLIVLDMFKMEFVQLPQSLAGLENLRTLRLSDCKLGDVSTIGKLQNLVSLSFYGSNIEELPKEVGELSNLTVLDLTRCVVAKAITPGVIRNLSQLEALYLENACVSELIHLSRLKILEIHIQDASMLPDDVLFGNLTKFNILIGEALFGLEFTDFCLSSQILKLTCISKNEVTKAGIKMLMKKAQHLEFADVSGISVALPSHLGGFRTLKELIVSHCKDVNYVLDMSESEYEPETPSLQQLHLINLPSLKEIIRGKFPSMFVSELEHLRLETLPSLVHLWQFPAESVALPNLTTMQVKWCNELKHVFEQSAAKSLLKLKELEVENCRNLEAIYLTKEEEEDNVIDFPQLSHLKLSELKNLTSFGSKFTSESTLFGKQVIFRALERLDINNLEKLEKIWHVHTRVGSFFKLKVLNLTKCPELFVVLSPQATSTLPNLEEICIRNCDKLETLVQVQSDDVPLKVGDEMILFPRLLTLKLVNLPKFTAILSITSQNIFQATVIFRALERLDINNLVKLENIWHIHPLVESFFKLKILKLTKCSELLVVFSPPATPALPNLEEICIENCDKLETLVQVQSVDVPLTVSNEMILFPRLLSLKLVNLPKFTAILNTTSQNICQATVIFCALERLDINNLVKLERIWHAHPLVETFFKLKVLKLTKCPELVVVFSPQATSNLPNLEEICIEDCDKLETLVQVQSDDVPLTVGDEMNLFPRLLTLKLVNLPKFTAILSITSQNIFQTTVIFRGMERLDINNLVKLKKIWHIHPLVESFFKLKILKLTKCPELLVVFSPPATSALPNLEEICIENCDKLETLVQVQSVDVPLTVGNEMIFFPRLLILKLVNLPKFTAILSTTSQNICQATVIFRALESLDINNLVKLERIWHAHPLVKTFFKLKVLKLTKCPELVVVFSPQATSNLPNLEEICIEDCDKLETLVQVHSVDIPLTVGDEMILFPRLLTLKLVNLPKFTAILSITSQNISQATVSFGRLSYLELKRVELIEEIWHRDHPATTVDELRVLKVKCCDRLLTIFSSNLLAGLQNLAILTVQSCASLEHVFAVEDYPPFLSNLQELLLYNLPKLKQLWWNENTCESFGLPSLHSFLMDTCQALQYVFDASVANHLEHLECLYVWNCSSIVEIVEEKSGRKIMFPLLKILHLKNLPCFKGLNPYVQFPQVEEVVVDHCLNIKEPHRVNVGHVRNIQLQGSMSFFASLVECWKTGMLLPDAQ